MEKIYFSDSKGNKVCGILSGEASTSVIILCHGFITSKESSTNIKLEKRFDTIETLRFDFFGHGESEGEFEDITISKAVDDILSAISFLKEKGFRKIGLIGSSFGGNASLIAASKTDDLFVLALKSPVSNYYEKELQRPNQELEQWESKGYIIRTTKKGEKKKLKYTFFEDTKKNDSYKAARKIKIPVLIVHGDQDEDVPIIQSKKTSSILKNGTLEIVDGADHKYSKPKDFEKMITLLSAFVKFHNN